MSKLLAALSVIQIFAIAFLAARIIEFDARLRQTEENAAERATIATAEPAPRFIPADAVIAEAAPTAADANLLRRIIREELGLLRSAAPAPARSAEPAADPRMVDSARRDLDRLIGRGRADAKDIDLYLDKLAQLPSAERTKALRALTKAMNDGRLEGHF